MAIRGSSFRLRRMPLVKKRALAFSAAPRPCSLWMRWACTSSAPIPLKKRTMGPNRSLNIWTAPGNAVTARSWAIFLQQPAAQRAAWATLRPARTAAYSAAKPNAYKNSPTACTSGVPASSGGRCSCGAGSSAGSGDGAADERTAAEPRANAGNASAPSGGPPAAPAPLFSRQAKGNAPS